MHVASYNRPTPGDSLSTLNAKLKAIGENKESELINIEDYCVVKKMFENCYSKYDFIMEENITGYKKGSKIYHNVDELEEDDVSIITCFDNKIIGKDVA